MLLSLIFGIALLGACSQNDNKMNDMDQSTMEHEMDDDMMEGHMDHDMMEGHMDHDDEVSLNDSTGKNELKIPKELEQDEKSKEIVYTVQAQKGKTEIFDGTQTDTIGYNGAFLGPMLRFNKGDIVKIKTINELDEETTFHWHGLEVAGDADGGPHSALQPGEEKVIEFKVDQEAATLWFHPHPNGKTSEQVYNGLAGLIYIEDENSKSLGLPNKYGQNDIPLIFQDRTFDDERQLNYDDRKSVV